MRPAPLKRQFLLTLLLAAQCAGCGALQLPDAALPAQAPAAAAPAASQAHPLPGELPQVGADQARFLQLHDEIDARHQLILDAMDKGQHGIVEAWGAVLNALDQDDVQALQAAKGQLGKVLDGLEKLGGELRHDELKPLLIERDGLESTSFKDPRRWTVHDLGPERLAAMRLARDFEARRGALEKGMERLEREVARMAALAPRGVAQHAFGGALDDHGYALEPSYLAQRKEMLREQRRLAQQELRFARQWAEQVGKQVGAWKQVREEWRVVGKGNIQAQERMAAVLTGQPRGVEPQIPPLVAGAGEPAAPLPAPARAADYARQHAALVALDPKPSPEGPRHGISLAYNLAENAIEGEAGAKASALLAEARQRYTEGVDKVRGLQERGRQREALIAKRGEVEAWWLGPDRARTLQSGEPLANREAAERLSERMATRALVEARLKALEGGLVEQVGKLPFQNLVEAFDQADVVGEARSSLRKALRSEHALAYGWAQSSSHLVLADALYREWYQAHEEWQRLDQEVGVALSDRDLQLLEKP